MPQIDIVDFELNFSVGADCLSHSVALFIFDCISDFLIVFKACYKALDFSFGSGTNDIGSHHYALATVIVKVEVAFAYTDDIHIAVKSAIESEVCHLRINLVVSCVVNNNNKQTFIL